jgi:polysaccharide pyruvyl transferase WcaK-like protein
MSTVGIDASLIETVGFINQVIIVSRLIEDPAEWRIRRLRFVVGGRYHALLLANNFFQGSGYHTGSYDKIMERLRIKGEFCGARMTRIAESGVMRNALLIDQI